jgi:aspartyl-tRNA(Asn)/glutamyl-tRNA(Gln) amidotransferase subunit B
MSSIYDSYELVCGLEVHVQLKTQSKAYAGDENKYGAIPNTLVSPITLGHPGTLPVMNRKSVDLALRLGIAFDCEIASRMYFARKNYFYADLPKGYQITQDKTPICIGGKVFITMKDGEERCIDITRIHLEEDSGKSIHDQDPFNTLVDLNRAGVPLVEIVSEPDFRDPEEAYAFLTEVRRVLRYLDVSDGNMEEGSMRCDANISVRKRGETELNQRTEVKNMNSFRNVQRAINFEFKRQIDLVEAGGTVHMETRSYDAAKDITFSLRSKEEAHDYRYFPEPDLQPLTVTKEELIKVKAGLPLLPRQLIQRYTTELGLGAYDAGILTEEKETALYYEQMIAHTSNYKSAANWLMGEVRSWVNKNASDIERFPVTAERMAGLVNLIDQGKVSSNLASQSIFPLMLESQDSAEEIAKKNDLIQNSDQDSLRGYIDQALATYPDKVEAYKNGNKGLLGLFMGEVMKLSERKADPKATTVLLKEILEQ